MHVVSGMAFSPDGKKISTCGSDSTVITWDVTSGECLWRFKDDIQEICDFRSISYSPYDGRYLACAADDGTVKVFDTAATAVDQVWVTLGTPNKAGHAGRVHAAVFSTDGAHIVTAGIDKSVRLWDARTGAPGKVFRGHLKSVRDVIFLPNGRQIASCGNDNMIRFWDMPSSNSMGTVTSSPNKQEQVESRHIHEIKQVLNMPGSQHIASCSSDSVRIWHKETGELCHTFRADRSNFLFMAVSPCGGKIVIVVKEGTLRRIDLPSGFHQPELRVARDWQLSEFEFEGHDGIVTPEVLFSSDGVLFACAFYTVVQICNWVTGKKEFTIPICKDENGRTLYDESGFPVGSFEHLCFSPVGGCQLAIADSTGYVHLWDMTKTQLEIQHALQVHPLVMAYSYDGTAIWMILSDGAQSWDPKTGTPIINIKIGGLKQQFCDGLTPGCIFLQRYNCV